jgi:FkbM family methyltransferase
MNRHTLDFLLFCVQKVQATGLMDTRPGWSLYTSAYRIYKRVSDRHTRLLRPYVPDGSVAIDVGANIGCFTLSLIKWVGPGGCVIAIEPEPRNVASLRKAVDARRGRTGVTIIEGVAADMKGNLRLSVNRNNPADHRIAAAGLSVPAFTIDGIAQDMGPKAVSFLKIDVQGAECLVLRGADATIRRFRPALYMEVYEEGMRAFGHSAVEMLSMVTRYGYHPHLLSTRGVERISAERFLSLAQTSGYFDSLFLPTAN